MTKNKRKKISRWIYENLKNLIAFAGPIVFEVVNEITGSWTDGSGKIHIGIGKFITILIAIIYFGVLGYLTYIEKREDDERQKFSVENSKLKKACDNYKSTMKSLCDVYSYTADKTREQIKLYKKNKNKDTFFMNVDHAATIVCQCLYEGIKSCVKEESQITVNYYRKYYEDKNKYTEMIAHEGFNSSPKYFKVPRLLKLDKGTYYCEKILNNDNPEMVFLGDKEAVRKAFKINGEECKYNQYIAMPIRRNGSCEKVALIEIVAHNNSVIWDNEDDAREYIYSFCKPFMEYFLLVDVLSNFYELLDINSNDENMKGEVDYGKDSEVLQRR